MDENKDYTVLDIIEEVKSDICISYCKWPNIWDEEKEGNELCDSDICRRCPLNRL